MLIISVGQAQVKWYKVTKNDVVLMSLQTIAGTADGLNQAIAFKKLGKGDPFVDFETSWQRKYKNWPEDKREKFPLSSTLLVGYTDAYHMTRMVGRWTTYATVGFSFAEIKEYKKKDLWKVAFKKALLSYAANRVAFTITYNSF